MAEIAVEAQRAGVALQRRLVSWAWYCWSARARYSSATRPDRNQAISVPVSATASSSTISEIKRPPRKLRSTRGIFVCSRITLSDRIAHLLFGRIFSVKLSVAPRAAHALHFAIHNGDIARQPLMLLQRQQRVDLHKRHIVCHGDIQW